MFVFSKLFQLSVMLHSSLLDPFMSYEENEVLVIQTQGPNFLHNLQMVPISLSVTLITLVCKGLPGTNTRAYWAHF
jgi:hypothetical protein